jgi:hypothetical protein
VRVGGGRKKNLGGGGEDETMARPVVLALFPLDFKTLIEGGNSDIKSTVVLPRMCFDPSFLLTLTFTIISYTNYHISDETAQWTSFHHTREGIRVPSPPPAASPTRECFFTPRIRHVAFSSSYREDESSRDGG